MESLNRFSAIVLADLRERTRSARFWVVLGLVMFATWRCFPPLDAHYMILTVANGTRGHYSSAWVGMVLALVSSSLFSLFGFYLVRGTLVRDIDTRVWQLLVATPMTRRGFLLAKWTSHMAVFALIMTASIAVGLAAQWVRAEDRSLDLLELIKPILILALPSFALTATFAVCFDLLPWLRRTAGNVLFFFLWLTMLSAPVAQLSTNPDSVLRTGWVSDQGGMAMMARDFHRVREQQTGKPQGYGFSIGNSGYKNGPVLFDWRHWQVRPMDVLGRALWLVLALIGVMAGAPLLDWAAARSTSAHRDRDRSGRRLRWLDPALKLMARGPLGLLVAAELQMVLRQRRLVWWLAATILWVVQAVGTPTAMAAAMMLAWLLALDVLARGVLRERDNGTGGLVFVANGVMPRLLLARFLIGLGMTAVLSAPGLLRLAAQSPTAVLAGLVAVASISSWGLALGALCRNPRPFELLLIVLVYLGLQNAPVFDFAFAPQVTLSWHALLLVPAWLALSWAWPRLASR